MPPETRNVTSFPPGLGDRATGSPSPINGTFRKEGEYWTVGYGNTAFRLKDTKGFAYLAHLLRHPGTEFHVLDLVGGMAAGGRDEPKLRMPRGDDELQKAGINITGLGDAGEMLDEQAKLSYRRRLSDLREELEEAKERGNVERAGRVEQEIDALTRERPWIEGRAATAACSRCRRQLRCGSGLEFRRGPDGPRRQADRDGRGSDADFPAVGGARRHERRHVRRSECSPCARLCNAHSQEHLSGTRRRFIDSRRAGMPALSSLDGNHAPSPRRSNGLKRRTGVRHGFGRARRNPGVAAAPVYRQMGVESAGSRDSIFWIPWERLLNCYGICVFFCTPPRIPPLAADGARETPSMTRRPPSSG